MANTYTSLLYHIVFSTKNRMPFTRPEVEDRVWAYVGGIARNHNVSYIQHQRAHHQTQTFQEEYLDFLTKAGIEYNEGLIQASLTRRRALSHVPWVETHG